MRVTLSVGLLIGALCMMSESRGPRVYTPSGTSAISDASAHSRVGSSALSHYLNESSWNKLFPHRYALGTGGKEFYSFKALEIATAKFPDFLNEKEDIARRRELAAFLANIAQETSGGWAQAPGGYFTWGLFFIKEKSTNPYNDTSKHRYPGVVGKAYVGRGPAQLSWNYNYGQFSEAWYGDKQTLLDDPDKLTEDPVLSFGSALWFWMTPQHPKPSCHDIMAGTWAPTADDIAKGRHPGFGATVNIINGGVECGSGRDQQRTTYRYAYYKYFCQFLNVAPGEHIECTDQTPFGQ